MSVESEIREFLVSNINFNDLDESSQNKMVKNIISAYCQSSTIRDEEFRIALNNLKRFFDYGDDSWGRSMSYHEGGSDYFNPVALGMKIARMKGWFDIIYNKLQEDKDND